MLFKRAVCFLTIIVLLLNILFPISLNAEHYVLEPISSGNFEKGFRYNIQGWTYIHLEGEPYDRGYQYGYLAATEIIDIIQRWINFGHFVPFLKFLIIKSLPKNYDKLSKLWWNICKSKSMRYFEKHIPEENKEEIRGMVAGLNEREAEIFGRSIEYKDIVASQFIQEVWYAFYDLSRFQKFHPLRKLIYGLKNILNKGENYEELGHCRALIATGDATESGGIVAAHATIFHEYIAERCNFIVDIKPTKGYRFMMTAPPGSLWSQEDFYQNEKGIILTETELVPQGPFNIRKIPKGIRSRTAIQYSASIDEVIKYLQKGNSGLIPNEWLIGDTKTGEIARLEQALYNTPITRAKNGFFFSCCVPHNNKVERELWGFIPKSIAIKKYDKNNKYNNKVIEKFNELEKKYHGKINTEIAKKILTTDPISKRAIDCKITSSKFLDNMGMIVYFGLLDGTEFNPSEKLIQKFKGITKLPPSGWLEIHDSNIKNTGLKSTDTLNFDDKYSKVLWSYEIDTTSNIYYSSSIVSDQILILADSSGKIVSKDAKSGRTLLNKKHKEKSAIPSASNEFIFIGTKNGLFKLNKDNGEILWKQDIGEVTSKPSLYKNAVIASFSNGYLRGFDVKSGAVLWSHKFSHKPYISERMQNIISIASGNSCYGFNLATQEIIWEFKTDKIITASPKISENTVYVGSWDGNIYALNYKKGTFKWKYQTGWAIDSTPDISEGLVYIGSLDNNFYALDEKSGSLEWYFTCKSAIHSNPVAYGNYVFFGCDDGRLYAINKTNGDLVWSFTPKYSINSDAYNYITTPIISNPTVEDSVVYFNAKGTLYALDAQTFEKPKEISEGKIDFNIETIILIIAFIFIITIIILLINLQMKKKRTRKK